MANWFTRLFIQENAPFEAFEQRSAAPAPVPVAIEPIDTTVNGTEQRAAPTNYTLKSQEAIRLLAFGTPSLSGVAVNSETILGSTPAWRAISLISNGLAMLDRVVKRKKGTDIFPADEHPIARLFATRPHPHYTWFDMLVAWIANAVLGNGYIRIHWDYETMRPWSFEHIPSGMVWVEYDMYGNLWYIISGEINGRQVTTRVPSTDMLHLKGLTMNGINGKQVAIVHRSTIGSNLASKQYTESVFGKGAHPSIAVKYDQPLDSDERKNAKANFMAEQSGSDRAGEPIILDDGMSVQYLQWSPVDLALVDFNTLSVEDFCRMFGIPRDLMALDGHGTYGAAVQRSQDLLTHCLGAWIEKAQEEINTKIFWKSEQGKVYFEFDTSVYTALDPAAEAERLSLLVRSSLMTPNEGRRKLGMNPQKGGDELFGDINFLPLKDLLEVATAKYLSSEGEKLRGQSQQPTPKANNQNHTTNAPTGQ